MYKEELRSIRKRVFELTVTSTTASNLDLMLERLLAILRDYHDLPLESRGAIVLLNPRGSYFQVAQFGMEPAWESHLRWDSGIFSSAAITQTCQVETVSFLSGDGDEQKLPQRLFLLPLCIDGQGIGYTVLFVPLDYQSSLIHLDFMNDLAYALSGLVHRVLTNETLRIRELELEEARADAIRNLGLASEYRDTETGWHIMRMANFAQAIAKAMGLPTDQRELLYVAAPMHDVGKIGIADAVLLKPGKLTHEEFEIMKTHTNIGVSILMGNDALIAAARDIAGSHHERWDGAGYPQGLAGEQIPILARICSVADVFDALTSTRPYKKPWTVEDATAWIISESGKHFDPAIVEAFKTAMPEILRVRELYRDDIIDPKQVLTLPPIEPREDVWAPWNESLSVGIDIIDEHHRYLFDLINDLYDVVINKLGIREVARLIKALDAYAKVHFRAEELMMTHYEFEGTYRQQYQHHAFEAKIREFYEELHANPLVAQFDVLSYLRDWLVKHILVEDSQLRSLVRV
ncbi:bacteriohemerythrin [Methylobacter sp.]|uniref:bacteriohemerythrin n=1 Tax=Methylobacter sp. TaxID=2051955 RepID=UPI0011FD62CE|nr:bacteriohemerythrin [Methylobacter sp.]TAK65037.1 MAG: bacteriohemerythrin [Methylobacter sp.]